MNGQCGVNQNAYFMPRLGQYGCKDKSMDGRSTSPIRGGLGMSKNQPGRRAAGNYYNAAGQLTISNGRSVSGYGSMGMYGSSRSRNRSYGRYRQSYSDDYMY